MFRRYELHCGRSAVHGPHKRWDRDLDRLSCEGVLRFDPMRPETTFPKHKHFYRLTNILVTPQGFKVSRDNIYWQCECWAVYFTNRQSLREELTRKQVHQTWPA